MTEPKNTPCTCGRALGGEIEGLPYGGSITHRVTGPCYRSAGEHAGSRESSLVEGRGPTVNRLSITDPVGATPTSPTSDLLPCPFCGGTWIAYSCDPVGERETGCAGCSASAPENVWNTRAPSPDNAEARIAKAAVLLYDWSDKRSPSGDETMTGAERTLDDIGEVLGLWGRDAAMEGDER
jgi:hypothetical protein